MNPDDPRHGTYAGHVAGCRQRCCGEVKLAYDKRRKLDAHAGIDRKVPSWRAIRRIQALQRLGWSVPRIAEVTGLFHQQLYDLDRYPTCYVQTFEAISATYERLCMTLPPARTTGERISVTRSRRNAERNRWPAPLAWDDIDDPNERPRQQVEFRTTHQADELLAEIDHLTSFGVSLEQAARQMKVSLPAIEKARARVQKRAAA